MPEVYRQRPANAPICKGSPREDEAFGYPFISLYNSPVHERGLMNAFISKITIWIGEWTKGISVLLTNGDECREGRMQMIRDGHADIDIVVGK